MTHAQLRSLLQHITLIGVLFSVTLSGGSVGIVSLSARLILVGLAVLAALMQVMFIAQKGQRLSTALDYGWLAMGAATFLSVFSGDPRRSIEFWIFPLALQLPYFYGAIALLRNRWPPAAYVRVIVIVGALLFARVVIVLIKALADWHALQPPDGSLLPPDYRLFDVLDNPNVFGAYLALIIPAVIGYLGTLLNKPRSTFERGALVIWLGGALLCLIATGSRNNQFATSIGTAAALALIVLSDKSRSAAIGQWLSARLIRKVGVAIGGMAIALLLIGVVAYESSSAERVGGALKRLDLWRTALGATAQHPILGVGVGSYPIALMQTNSIPPVVIERHAHNIFFNTLAENGIIGLIALLFFGGLLIRAALISWRTADSAQRTLYSGIMGGLIAFLLSNLFDTPLLQAAPLFIAVTYCALLCAPLPAFTQANIKPLREHPILRFWMVTASFVVSAIGVVLVALYVNQWTGAQAGSAQVLDRGVALDPHDPLIRAQAAVTWAQLVYRGANTDTSTLDQAIAHYQDAIRLDPTYAVHHLNLAMLLKRRGALDAALDQLAIAVWQAPNSAVMRLNYGVALETAGQSAAALDQYEHAIALNERWRAALFWQSTPLRQQAARETPLGTLAPYLLAMSQGDQARDEGHTSAAIDAYTRAAQLAGDDTSRAVARGMIAFSSAQWVNARYEFNVAIALAGTDATRAILYLGDLYGVRSQPDAMQAQYAAAFARIDRYSAFGPGQLGDITYAVNVFGRFGYVSDYLPDVLLLDLTPFEAAEFVKLARYERARGNSTQATAIDQRILVANPSYAPALEN